jgi:hypothetical protein
VTAPFVWHGDANAAGRGGGVVWNVLVEKDLNLAVVSDGEAGDHLHFCL